ncbi:hypothetical protein MSAN_00481100 [Mycena sanguinolenta]|uniref:Secreted protein n=1 Tax=Mycena sanguinolenta TaxID=230812 RepID=A0A8H6ZBP8_9AGAR|nr:hypothetical protein MSAN_00481100 [Mycena sanguinolenta]
MVRLVFLPFAFLPPTLRFPFSSLLLISAFHLSSPSVPADNAAKNAVYISASSTHPPLTQHVARLPLLQDPPTTHAAHMRPAQIGHAQRLRCVLVRALSRVECRAVTRSVGVYSGWTYTRAEEFPVVLGDTSASHADQSWHVVEDRAAFPTLCTSC